MAFWHPTQIEHHSYKDMWNNRASPSSGNPHSAHACQEAASLRIETVRVAILLLRRACLRRSSSRQLTAGYPGHGWAGAGLDVGDYEVGRPAGRRTDLVEVLEGTIQRAGLGWAFLFQTWNGTEEHKIEL